MPMPTTDEAIRANVRAEMARRDINQTTLALDLGLTQPQLSKRLRGVVSFRTDELAKIAAIIGVPLAFLFEDHADAETIR